MIKKIVVLCAVLCISIAAYAQTNLANAARNAAKTGTEILPQLERATAAARKLRPRRRVPGETIISPEGTFKHDPVFGYVPLSGSGGLADDPGFFWLLGDEVPSQWDDLVQIYPFFKHHIKNFQLGPDEPFDFGSDISLSMVTSIVYFWRLGHPEKVLEKDNPYIYGWAQYHLEEIQKEFEYNEGMCWELPNMVLLEHLLDPNFTPTSYADLYQRTEVYPQRIALDEQGFPVRTADAEYADILDAYLMLALFNKMHAYNVFGSYTPLILTKEEKEAANKLLGLLHAGDRLPKNPTLRDVIRLAYERLYRHTLPPDQQTRISRGLFIPYPNYRNTQLYRTIQGMIKDQEPVETMDPLGYITLENTDMVHLIILDAIMGGVANFAELKRALYAFERLCANTHPEDERAITHLTILRENLRSVFDRFISNNESSDNISETNPRRQKIEVAKYAVHLLEESPMTHWVGRNWKPDGSFTDKNPLQ